MPAPQCRVIGLMNRPVTERAVGVGAHTTGTLQWSLGAWLYGPDSYIRNGVAEFRWNQWNVEHLARHSVKPEEAEDVVIAARQPYPLERPDAKWLVWGRTPAGRALQVVFVLDDDDTIYVIHARDLTTREKQRYRRRRR